MKIKKMLFPILASTVAFPIAIVSCSNNSEVSEFLSEQEPLDNYNNVYNISFEQNDFSNNNLANMKISDFQNVINDLIKNDSSIKKLMKLYCFNILFQAIKNPYDRKGKRISTLTDELNNYAQFLTDKTKPDLPDDDDKTFNNLNNFIDSISDIKINVLSFKKNENNEISFDNDSTIIENIRNNLANNGGVDSVDKNIETLNFQIEFRINNDEANSKMLDANGQSIFYKTSKLREERKLIRKYQNNPNKDISKLIDNQFTYQGTKMYYDVETKTFKTIVLNSNIKKNQGFFTPNSGFIDPADTNRECFYFDFKQIGSSDEYEQYLILNLTNGSYFDTNITTDWSKYLEQEKFVEDGKMKPVVFKFNKTIIYKKPTVEQKPETDQNTEQTN